MKRLFGMLVAVIAGVVSAKAETFSRDGLTFSVDVPASLENVSILDPSSKVIFSRVQWSQGHDNFVRLFSISDMGNPIGRDDMSKAVAHVPNAKLEKVAWKKFQVDVFRVVEETADARYVTFNAQIPLAPRAIQVRIAGPASDEPALRLLLNQTLASLDGRTNWLSLRERVGRLAQGATILVLLFGGSFWWLRIRKLGTSSRVGSS